MAYRLIISITYEYKKGVEIRLPICVSCHVANSMNVVRPIVYSGTPSQSVIELAVDLVALLDHVITHLADLGALEFDLVLRTEAFDHRIEALMGPRDELTKAMDGDPLMAFAETV